MSQIPVHLIGGFLGVGKTTAINHLLTLKPAEERWALVINELGQVGVDGQLIESQAGVQVKEIAGGCICCSMGLSLSVTLLHLLRHFKPDRIVIEPTGLGHPAGMVDVLTSEQFAGVLDLHPVITLVDVRQLKDPRVLKHETFQDQLSLADILVFNKADLADPEELAAAMARAEAFFPPKLAVIRSTQGELPAAILASGKSQVQARQSGKTRPVSHQAIRHPLMEQAALPQLAWPQPRQPVFLQGQGQGVHTLGWVFHRQDCFDEDRLYQWMLGLPDLIRLKAVMRVAQQRWQAFNCVGSEWVTHPVSHRRDSRLELITEQPLNQSQLQSELMELMRDDLAT